MTDQEATTPDAKRPEISWEETAAKTASGN